MTRRILVILFTAMVLITGACSSDGDNKAESAPSSTGADSSGDTDRATDDDSDDATSSGNTGGGNKSGPSGRLEIGDDAYNFYLGEMTTATCSIKSEDSVTIQDMRASDGTWVAAMIMGGTAEITVRGPDGNHMWITGTTDDAMGVDVTINVFDNVLSVKGTWVEPGNPSNTQQGQLVITC